jgi:polysaccharide biosynthesis protein PelA
MLREGNALKIFLLYFLLPITLFATETVFPWVVYYNDKAPAEAFAPYNPIVLDSHTHPPLTQLLAQKKEVLGYLNLSEAETFRPWFNALKNEGVFIRENHHWKGSWIVDIRKPVWKNYLLEQIIPQILAQGFTGLFYDQLDNAIALEKEDPQKYQGMTAAAIDLVISIRARFPGKRIMMNRAYEIIDAVGDAIDYALAESLYTDYDFAEKKHRFRSQQEIDWQLALLNKGRKKFPHLVIFSLDYWDPEDKEAYKKIYAKARGDCLRPYVSTLALDKIIPEPKKN